MSLHTLQSQDLEILIPKLAEFGLPHKSEKSFDFSDDLKSMARGCLIENCEFETIDNNPKKNALDKRPGASVAVLESMKLESNRLKSFDNRWPLSFVFPHDLAAVGLFYLGVNDNVQCAFCHGIISDWVEGDEPLEEHVKHFPMCPYLLNCDVGNVPISGVNGRQKWQVQSSRSECGGSCQKTESRAICEPSSTVVQSFRPKFPSMGSFDRRLATYGKWLPSTPLTPVQLAEAGLFYSGVADVATCFSCGGSMGNWCEGDQAWEEHAKHFPDCAYVKCIKGSQFTESVRQPRTTFAAENMAAKSIEPLQAKSEVTTEAKKSNTSDVSPSSSAENEASVTQGEQQKYICKICMDEGSRVVFVPCGHSLACPKCAANLTNCPMCRKKIEASVKLFFDE